ncbi:MAG TPA: hypothetical protein VJH97_00130 [Candidatus Nanoarchaeia archaeon]|nr:hypothetical protein [Candidatus Nanoarchaeia archaeon]
MLEKIVNFVRISPKSVITCSLGVGVFALSSIDGVQARDIFPYVGGSIATILGIHNGMMEYKLYREVAYRLQHGIRVDTSNENIKRYARIYSK